MMPHPILRASLLPVEHWEYGLRDIAHVLHAAPAIGGEPQRLYLDDIGPCIPTRSARCAIVLALQALGLPAGAHVGVPLYCCPIVFKAIRAAGMRARFIDVEPNGLCLAPDDLHAKRHDCDAVIAVHTFGQVCDMQSIVSVGLPVIEDCAQALCSRTDGKPAGLLGDLAVFSFRSGKYLSVGEGGALHTRHISLQEKLEALTEALPASGLVEDGLHATMTLLRSALRSRPLWGLLGEWMWSVNSHLNEFAPHTPILMTQIYRSDLRIARERLGRLSEMVERQRAHARWHSRHLRDDLCAHAKEARGQWWNRYLYPLLFHRKDQRDVVAQFMHRRGIGTIKPYSDSPSIATRHFNYAGDCPHAESVAQRVLIPPSSHALGHTDLHRIARAFNDACSTAVLQTGIARPRSRAEELE